jgi:hypothetical protein
VGKSYVPGVSILVCINGDGGDTRIFGSANNPNSDFTAIGDE